MKTRMRLPIKAHLLTACAIFALCAFGSDASASLTRIDFNGAMGSGYADLTLGNTDPLDVVDANRKPRTIIDASGMFNGVAITGILPVHPTAPPAGETMIPNAYSLFSIPGYGDHDGVSYDNLFYPSGSPMICYIDADGLGHPGFVWPFYGGGLDLLGVMFALDNGSFVDLWSFGVVDPAAGELPPFVGGLTYGLKVIQPKLGGGYEVLGGMPFATATTSVPEPALWPFGFAILGLFAWRRSAETRKRASRAN